MVFYRTNVKNDYKNKIENKIINETTTNEMGHFYYVEKRKK